MTDWRDDAEPISSEELIRRAREAQPVRTPPADSHPAADARDETDLHPAVTSTGPVTDKAEEQRPDAPVLVDTGEPVLVDPGRHRAGGWTTIWAAARWVIGAAVLFTVYGSCFGGGTSLDALDIGDCFDDPGDVAEVSTVDTVACSGPHDLELYATVIMGSSERAFPGADRLFDELEPDCVDRFDAYVGTGYWESMYDIALFTPLGAGWSEGDRTGMCALYEFDATLQPVPSIGSARNSGR